MIRIAVILVVGLFIDATAHAQGTAVGFVAFNQDRYELVSAAAMWVPDPLDTSGAKRSVRIVLADKPVPVDVLDDGNQISNLKKRGYHGLDVEISEDGKTFSVSAISAGLRTSLTISGTFDRATLSVFSRQRVKGVLATKPAQIGDVAFSYHVAFHVPVAPLENPTASDAVAAAAKESTRRYLAFLAAIRAGDKQQILALSRPDQRPALDTPDFTTRLRAMQAMTPQSVEVLKATESGERARLLVRATWNGQKGVGRIYLSRVEGNWFLDEESWTSQ